MSPRLLHAPDYRDGTPYQRLLAGGLEAAGVEVNFLSDYHHGLPLARGLWRSGADLLHLHWADPYCRGWRALHYGPDLRLAAATAPLVVTTHNLQPHESAGRTRAACDWWTHRLASAVIVHNAAQAGAVVAAFGVAPERVHIVPHGNEAAAYPAPVPSAEARERLGLPAAGKLALFFGALRGYKGQAAIMDWWARHAPEGATLAVVGSAQGRALQGELEALAGKRDDILLRIGYQSEEDTMLWHSAADAALCNYRRIFSSGATSLALGFGLPLLVPARCHLLDFAGVPGRVAHFHSLEGDFGEKLAAALAMGRSPEAAAQWARARDWAKLARMTRDVYLKALGEA